MSEVALYDLVQDWLDEHKLLRSHYKVANAVFQPEGIMSVVVLKCGFQHIVGTMENAIYTAQWFGSSQWLGGSTLLGGPTLQLNAADQNFFEKLRDHLILEHNRRCERLATAYACVIDCV